MLKDSFATAEQDMQARALVEARVEAQRMLDATRSALAADGHLLAADERADIDRLLAETEAALASTDPKHIEAATEAVAKGTEAFAAQRMNQSIVKALAGHHVTDI